LSASDSLLGLAVGSKCSADKFLRLETLGAYRHLKSHFNKIEERPEKRNGNIPT
jgi:hypothetical protein